MNGAPQICTQVMKDFAAFGILDFSDGEKGRAQIVLVEETPNDDDVRLPLLKLPGGRRQETNKYEPPIQTVAREIEEELGIRTYPQDTVFRQDMEGTNPHRFLVYQVPINGFKIENLQIGDGIRKVVILEAASLQEMIRAGECIAPIHSTAIRTYLQKKGCWRQ